MCSFYRDDTHKVDVINFAQNKAIKCLQNENLIDKESASLLWNFIVLLCRQNGVCVFLLLECFFLLVFISSWALHAQPPGGAGRDPPAQLWEPRGLGGEGEGTCGWDEMRFQSSLASLSGSCGSGCVQGGALSP